MPHAADKIFKNSFKKRDRLKSSLEIDALYRENQYVFSFPLKCYYSFSEKNENQSAVRAAFTVPKKTFKHAVQRNRLKRRMREAYRLHYKKLFENFLNQHDKQLKLFFIFVGKEFMEYEGIERNMKAVLLKLQ
jgi:ribonuclease P protein component